MTPHFTKRIHTPNGYVNFFFNRIYTAEGIRYHVSCLDTKNKSHNFKMKELLGHWVLAHPSKCVLWIENIEIELEKAILESLAKIEIVLSRI
jgi:hypothetical protein